LAIPLVIAISTSIAAQAGILVKDRLALERMRSIDAVLFDKTGTLTVGAPVVRSVASVGGDTAMVLRLAAAAETDSEHPLARAIVDAAGSGGDRAEATSFRSLTGRGVEASVSGSAVTVGGPGLMRTMHVEVPPPIGADVHRWEERGATVVFVLRDGEMIGAIALEDQVRPTSAAAIDELRRDGVRSVMVTGDARSVAEAVAADLGIDEVIADVAPQDKAAVVRRFVERGERVAMVGDGVNDAPALAGADVGIAIGAGTDVAVASAGVILASDDPRAVASVRRLSQASYRKMVQNLGWAVGYNVVAIPVAAGALAWAGVTLAPAVGALAMSVSTIVVALNAQLLRRVDLRPAGGSVRVPDGPVTARAEAAHHH
jgi:Cu2+-exporting ATPase